MASGRRDYTWGFLHEAASEGRYSEPYWELLYKTIEAGIGETIYTYTIPSGYRLGVTSVEMCSTSRLKNWIAMYINGVNIFKIFFDNTYSFIVSDKNPLYVNAGEIIYIDCFNADDIAYAFHGFITGVLEQVT